jgi:hypothetical protein
MGFSDLSPSWAIGRLPLIGTPKAELPRLAVARFADATGVRPRGDPNADAAGQRGQRPQPGQDDEQHHKGPKHAKTEKESDLCVLRACQVTRVRVTARYMTAKRFGWLCSGFLSFTLGVGRRRGFQAAQVDVNPER